MSKELATLLAQVIPVLAVALGLEQRAMASRLRDSTTVYGFSTDLIVIGIGFVGSMTLAAGEVLAIALVAGVEPSRVVHAEEDLLPGNPQLGNVLMFVIFLIFMAPALDLLLAKLWPLLQRLPFRAGEIIAILLAPLVLFGAPWLALEAAI